MTAKLSEEKREKILKLRAEDVSQADIAYRLGISVFIVSKVEREAGRYRRLSRTGKRRSFADDATGFDKT